MSASRSRDVPAFVVFGDDWGRRASTMQHLFSRIARDSTVVWVNSIGHREPGLSDIRRAWHKIRAMTRFDEGVPVSTGLRESAQAPQFLVEPRVLPWHSNRFVAAFNRWSLKRDIGRAVRDAGLRDYVMVTGSPPSANVIGECGERASIYFCMDDFLVLPGTSPRMLEPLERELLRRVDAVVATAQRLVAIKVCATGRGYHLPQGVNYEHFSTRRAIPPELRDLPRPIVGFAGGVGAAVDLPTLHAVSSAMPGASVVLVGPVTLPRESLAAPNIHVLGPRSYAELPAYVQSFDVGIIPYVENDWTHSVDPLKLLEYLAAGVPVVSSPLPEVMKYRTAVTTATLGDDFARAVVATAAGRGGARGADAQAVAAQHTWSRRAEQFLDIVADVSQS